MKLQISNLSLFIHTRAVIGEVDDETDGRVDFENVRAEPLNPVTH